MFLEIIKNVAFITSSQSKMFFQNIDVDVFR